MRTHDEPEVILSRMNGRPAKVLKGGPVHSDEHLKHLSGEMNTLGVLLADVEPEAITWISRGRFAAGKITVVDGDPGLGKSTVLTDWAAKVSRGDALPDGEPGEPRGVVILSAEDGVADTIRPRAEAAGADLSRIRVLTDLPGIGLPTIPDELHLIEATITQMDAALLIVDPFVAYLSEGYNANRDQDVRRALAPLAAMAERTGVAIAIVRHITKMAGVNALYRGGGSIGIIGAARFGLLFARDPEDETTCVIAPTKSNLSRMAPSLSYRLDSTAGDVARVTWLGESSMSAGQLLAGQEDEQERGALDEARDFLRDLLREGPHPAKIVKASARDAGITEQTLRRARESLGVTNTKEGFGVKGHWVWSLSPKVFTPPKVLTDEHLSTHTPPKVFMETPKVVKVFTTNGQDEMTTLAPDDPVPAPTLPGVDELSQPSGTNGNVRADVDLGPARESITAGDPVKLGHDLAPVAEARDRAPAPKSGRRSEWDMDMTTREWPP